MIQTPKFICQNPTRNIIYLINTHFFIHIFIYFLPEFLNPHIKKETSPFSDRFPFYITYYPVYFSPASKAFAHFMARLQMVSTQFSIPSVEELKEIS